MLLPNRHRLWWRLGLMVLAMAIFVLGYQWGNEQQRRRAQPPAISGVLLRPPLSLPALAVRDAFGRPFDVTAGWTLLAVGELAGLSGQQAVQRLIEIWNRLADRPATRAALRLALIDPSASLEQARDFMRLSPALAILQGEPETLNALEAALGRASASSEDPLYLIGPGGALLALLPRHGDGASLAADVAALHEAAFLLLPDTP